MIILATNPIHKKNKINIDMKVTLQSTSAHLQYAGSNDRGQFLMFDGHKNGVSPMESLLMASAACSSIDVEMIMEKMRQKIENIKVEVEGVRAETHPAVFTKIHLHYIVEGNIKEEKLQEALKLSMEKYCSVSVMLKATADISHTYEIRQIQS